MIRTGATEVVLFLLPFALYAVFLLATRANVLHPESWPISHLGWLLGAALLLVVGSFIYFANYSGAPVARPMCRRIWRTANSCRSRSADGRGRRTHRP